MTNPSPITEAHFTGIGKIAVCWARVENHVIRALEALLKIKRTDALIVFWHMAYRERMSRLITLFYAAYPDKNDRIRKEFDTLTRRMETAYEIRNMAAHSVWFKGQTPNAIKPVVVLAKGSDMKYTGRDLPAVEFTPERLTKEAEKIDRLAADFRDFFTSHCRARFIYDPQ